MKKKIAVAIPDSAVSDIFDIREKTIKLGMIARALAIFEVSTLFIYKDSTLSKDKATYERRFIRNVLSYIETPQYLRKTLFPFHKDLQFAGQLPPLATLHHPTEKLKSKQYRDGVLFLNEKSEAVVDVGAEIPIPVQNNPGKTLKKKKIRVTTRIYKDKNGKFFAEIIPKEKVEQKMYWGYRIKESNLPLSKFTDKKEEYIVIATSRKGNNYEDIDYTNILENNKSKKQLLFLFGSPKHGLQELLKGTEKKIKDIADCYVNTIPHSGVRSIRLEEAIPISLARLLPKLS
jgi:predicted SPOUT superfamily RNA methylase MTH1